MGKHAMEVDFPWVQPSADLVETIEHRIIPRLVVDHAPMAYGATDVDAGRAAPSPSEVATFAELAAGQDMTQAMSTIEGMRRQGLGLPDILLDLVAPAARLLGDQWLADRRSFADVTVGSGTLQRIVAVLGTEIETPLGSNGLAVLASPRKEQHTMGLQVLGELARYAGWTVRVETGIDEIDLIDLVAVESVAMVGFSVSNVQLAPALGRLVKAVRKHSIHSGTEVLLGGCPDLAECAGDLDATYVTDGRHALEWLSSHGA